MWALITEGGRACVFSWIRFADTMPPEEPTETSNDSFAWLDPQRFRRVEQAREDFATIWQCGAPADLLNMLRDRLMSQLDQLSDLSLIHI